MRYSLGMFHRLALLVLVLPLLAMASCTSGQYDGAMVNRRPPERDVAYTLDDLHDAASKADEDRYFARFTTDAVFLGTDDTERWTIAEFRAYAHPYFAKGQGWTYVPVERHITILPGGDAAYFDEKLDNAKYGRCRGTGVLVRDPKTRYGWSVAQYNLTVPIPNEMLEGVAAQIRAHTPAPAPAPASTTGH
jgi:hypothetical protein